jgi:hypothetical protein
MSAVLLLIFGAVSLACGCLMILFLIWGQSTAPPMYDDSEQVMIYLFCFTSPFLIIAAALLTGGYYAHRLASGPGTNKLTSEPAPLADGAAGGVPVQSMKAARAATVEPAVARQAETKHTTAAELPVKRATPPPVTTLETQIQTYQLEGNVEGLMKLLKSPETNDKAAELTIEALSALGLPAMEALCAALGDRSRLTRILSLKEQGANVGPLLRTAISSAAKFYRLKR